MSKYNWDLDKIKEAVKESVNFSEVLEKLEIPRLGNNGKTLRGILDNNNIDYSHFTGRAREYTKNEVDIEEYLSNRKSITSYKLKERLIKVGLKENKCENPECGIKMWHNKPIICQLHHIDGNHNNNSLDNLMMLCPNCHSLTDNYCGSANQNKEKYYCPDCGKEILKTSTYCSNCAKIHNRKVERPSAAILLADFKEFRAFTKIGEKYNITDNTVRKWFKYYNLPSTAKELKEYIKLF